jgi:GTPase SAR1 family protein
MVYDSTNGHSFAMIQQYWLQEVSKNTKAECMFFLFANKCDQKDRMEAEERQWCEMKKIRCF